MAVKYRGKRLKIVRAAGFRLGIGYLPHWRTAPQTDSPRELILWAGPWFFTWKLKKRDWKPAHWASHQVYITWQNAFDRAEGEMIKIERYRESRKLRYPGEYE